MNLQDIKNAYKIENNVKIVKISEGKIIKIKKYLSSKEKMLFVYDILGRCFGDDGKLIPTAVDISLRMNFVIHYTDLEIDLEKDDIFTCFDILEQSGVLDKILEVIPDNELLLMNDYVKEAIQLEIDSKNSIAGGIAEMGKAIAETSLPAFVEMVKEDPSILNDDSVNTAGPVPVK